MTPYIKKIAEKREGKIRIYLQFQRLSIRRWPMGDYRALDGPWSPFNVTTCLVLKRYGIFPFLVVQNAETRKKSPLDFSTVQICCDRTVQIVSGYRESGFRDI